MMTLAKRKIALALIGAIEAEVVEILSSSDCDGSFDRRAQRRDWVFGMEISLRQMMITLDPDDYYFFKEFNECRDRISLMREVHSKSNFQEVNHEAN